MNFQNDRYPTLSNNRCFLPTCLQSLKPSTILLLQSYTNRHMHGATKIPENS